MWITSSLIGIEGESLINVVIDGILRPKTGYVHSIDNASRSENTNA